MHDRTDHLLAAIDGALGDYATSDDAMRWTPEPPKRAVVPDLSGITFSPEQVEAIRQSMQQVGIAFGQMRTAVQDAFRTLVESPQWQTLRDFAESAEGRAFVEAARRVSCSCLCMGRHPGRNVCTGEAGDRAIRYRTARLGVVDVAMCDPCLEA